MKNPYLYVEIGLAILLCTALLILSPWTVQKAKDKEVKTETKQSQQQEKKETADAEPVQNKTKEPSPEAEEVIAAGQYPIMGKSSVTIEQMVNFFHSSGQTYPAEVLGKGGAADIETFCRLYYEEATAEGVRPEVAFVQTMKETGWLQYGGDSTIEQFNFSGLGTTGGGVQGNYFPDVQTGIRAQIQHLKAYATDAALSQACVDERYEYVTKGCAPYVEWLGQKENPQGYGWATGENYGYSIVEMIQKLKTF